MEESFDHHGIDGVRRAAQDMSDQLEAANAKARELSSLTAVAIAKGPEEVPESGAGQRRDPN